MSISSRNHGRYSLVLPGRQRSISATANVTAPFSTPCPLAALSRS